MTEKKKLLSLAAIVTVLLVSAAVVVHCSFLRQGREAAAYFSDFILLMLLVIDLMAVALRISMKRTVYAYRNIALIGGIIFISVFAVVFTAYLVSALRADDFTWSHALQELLQFPRRFSYYAVCFVMLVSLLVGVSNVALIRHEGFCLQNLWSLILAGFYMGGTVAVYFITDTVTAQFPDAGLFLLNTVLPLYLLLLLCYLECIFVGCALLGWKAARIKPSYDKDLIIILGCSIDKRGGLLPLLKGRVNRAIRFAWEQEIATGKPMKYLPSGGKGTNEVMSEASAMELYLLTRGAERDEVMPEKESVNTEQNMLFSKRIIDRQMPGAKVAFATTNYHILRSGILARKAGFDAEGIAGDTKWYFWPNGFIREFFGILALKRRTHILVAAALAVLSTFVGLLLYFLNIFQ